MGVGKRRLRVAVIVEQPQRAAEEDRQEEMDVRASLAQPSVAR
jgi:hypothetical protein